MKWKFERPSEPDDSCAAQGPRALCSAAATRARVKGRTWRHRCLLNSMGGGSGARREGQSISAISRELDLDRKTVATACGKRHGSPVSPRHAAACWTHTVSG